MPNHTPRFAQTQFNFTPQTKEIPLTQGKVAIVDAADYDWLSQWKWFAVKSRNTYYAGRNGRKLEGERRNIRMHREIANATPTMQVDHRDGNGLNNTRSNLRVCTIQQNQANRRSKKGAFSKYKGVSYDRKNKNWRAEIRVKSIRHNLGSYTFEEDAARAYDRAAYRFHGEFARLNF